MNPIQEIPEFVCQRIQGIFFDIDDTITHQGKLSRESYNALWEAKNRGLQLVPVTGRPAGWVDHIARMWPVDAVVGENGALIFFLKQAKMQRFFFQDKEEREKNRVKLDQIGKEILVRFPQLKIATDQQYRETDLAIDFNEEARISDTKLLQQVLSIFHSHKAQAKISSIHINGWFGNHDKLSACHHLIKHIWKNDIIEEDMPEYIYIGDSPNDEPLFQGFRYSAAVANIKYFQKQITNLPEYVARKEGAFGFAEIMAEILAKREAESK